MYIITAIVLIVVPIAFNVGFFMLQRTFGYPEILRRFQAGGTALRRTWYAFALSALLFMLVPVLVQQSFGLFSPPVLAVGTALGTLAGFAQFLGLIRWSFLVPDLARRYTDSGASPATREAVAVTFVAFHRYLGSAIGEHLGYILTALWTALLSVAILQTDIFYAAFGWIGLIIAVGIFIGVFEEAGWKPAAQINALSYVAWSVWLIGLGIEHLFLPR